VPDDEPVIPVPLPVNTGGTTPPEGDDMAEPIAEAANTQVALTAMMNGMGAANTLVSHSTGLAAQAFTASAHRRTDRADQLSGDSQAMWSIAMTTPTVLAGHGMRVANESGSGRSRAETNLPAATSAAGNAGTG